MLESRVKSQGTKNQNQNHSKKADKILSPDFILLFCIGFLGSALSNGLNSAVPVLIESVGGLAAYSGATTAVFSLAAGIGRFLGGNLSDHIGRKRVDLLGSALMIAGCAVSMISLEPAPLLIGRAVSGLGFAMITTATAAAAADMLPPSRIGEGIGYYGLGMTLSIAVAPACGVALVALGGGFSLFGGFAIMSVLALLLTFVCGFNRWRDKNHQESDVEHSPVVVQKPDLSNLANAENHLDSSDKSNTNALGGAPAKGLIEKSALPLALIQGLLSFGTLMFTCFASLYAVQNGLQQLTLFYVLMAVAVIVARLAFGRLMDICKPLVLLLPSLLLTAVSLLLLMLFQSDVSFVVSGVLYGLGGVFTVPLLSAEVVRRAHVSRWGAGNAMLWLSMDIGVGIGVVVLGAIIDAQGFTGMIAVSVLAMLAAMLASLLVFNRRAPKR